MTRTKLYFVQLAFAVPAVLLGYACFAVYESSGGDRTHVELFIVWVATQLAAYYTAYRTAIAVLRRKYPTWNGKIPKWGAKFETKDGRTLAKTAASEADQDITRTKLFLVLFAFGVLATLLWSVCLTVYANFEGDTESTGVIIAWLAALPAANYIAYRAAKAVLRRNHPTWNGKIPKRGAKFETKTEVEETS